MHINVVTKRHLASFNETYQKVSPFVLLCPLVIQLIGIIDDVTAVIFMEKSVALSQPHFLSNFLENWHSISIIDCSVWDCNSAFYTLFLKNQ